MLDERELNAAIAGLESREATFSVCAKLADLYTVRDHIAGQKAQSQPRPEQARAVNGIYGGSEFLRIVAGKDSDRAWAVMDELMDALHVVNPRVYDSVMGKLDSL